jgi:hypothetical protein
MHSSVRFAGESFVVIKERGRVVQPRLGRNRFRRAVEAVNVNRGKRHLVPL